eukprot:1328216-Pleurochrysis_carterae.AAC.1
MHACLDEHGGFDARRKDSCSYAIKRVLVEDGNGEGRASVRRSARTDVDTLGPGKDRGATTLKTTLLKQWFETREPAR